MRRTWKKLLKDQEGLCAITGLRLGYDGDCDDKEVLASLDRIDSDGHYEVGNLQVVCRFVNRWKNDAADMEFRRLGRWSEVRCELLPALHVLDSAT